jgi:hypothetical protein
MTKQEMIKPFAWGLVTGAAAIAIVAFSADWVVTTGERDQQVQAAMVNGQASICASLVQAHRVTSGDITDLSGWSARDARKELASTFAVALLGQEMADPRVITACADLVGRNNT